MSKFYRFKQNNSGGSFATDKNVSIVVHIEANSANEANDIAQQHTIYFDGVENGNDCECCGDRWSPVLESDGYDEVYTTEYDDYWVKINQVYAYIYMLDGTKKELRKVEK